MINSGEVIINDYSSLLSRQEPRCLSASKREGRGEKSFLVIVFISNIGI